MRHIRQMLRLSAGGTSVREIAAMLGIARSMVQDNLDRAKAAGLNWPLPGELTDDAREHRLFTRAGVKQGKRRAEGCKRYARQDDRHGTRHQLCRDEPHRKGRGHDREAAETDAEQQVREQEKTNPVRRGSRQARHDEQLVRPSNIQRRSILHVPITTPGSASAATIAVIVTV